MVQNFCALSKLELWPVPSSSTLKQLCAIFQTALCHISNRLCAIFQYGGVLNRYLKVFRAGHTSAVFRLTDCFLWSVSGLAHVAHSRLIYELGKPNIRVKWLRSAISLDTMGRPPRLSLASVGLGLSPDA